MLCIVIPDLGRSQQEGPHLASNRSWPQTVAVQGSPTIGTPMKAPRTDSDANGAMAEGEGSGVRKQLTDFAYPLGDCRSFCSITT